VIERDHLVGEVADYEMRPPGAVIVRGVHTHSAAGTAVLSESDAPG
jgi:hypothetical protein